MEGAAIAAICTGAGGLITSYAALVRARRRGTKHCEEQLAAARAEAEKLAADLHAERMRGDAGKVDVLWLFAVGLLAAALIFGSLAIGSAQSTTGEQGPPGPPGKDSTVPGPPGSTTVGVPGEPGQPGQPGAAGSPSDVAGPPGRAGATGSQGRTGAAGSAGAPGAAGAAGKPGERGPQGVPGKDSTVPGPQGIPGVQGRQGEPGPTCPRGSKLQPLQVKVSGHQGGTIAALLCVVGG